MSDAARDWDQQLIEEQEALEADQTVKEVAIILLTRDVTGTPWLDWDVWAEQCTDDERLDALRTAQAVVEYMREHGSVDPSSTCSQCGVTVTDQTPSTFYPAHDERCGGDLSEPEGRES